MHGRRFFARQAAKNTRPQLFLYCNVTRFKYQKIGSPYHQAGSATLAADAKSALRVCYPLVNQ
jgi:hypothetical protein